MNRIRNNPGASSSLKHLRNRHRNATIYVLGSGPSLNFVNPEFFRDKLVISTNLVQKIFRISPDYCFSHHWPQIRDIIFEKPATIFVVNELNWPGFERWDGEIPPNLILHNPRSYANSQADFDPRRKKDSPGSKHLVFGSSSIHGAMHLGAWLGAREIILVGADNARIDGKTNVSGYPPPTIGYDFDVYQKHLILMKMWLEEKYKLRVYSLNPFVNLRGEGNLIDF